MKSIIIVTLAATFSSGCTLLAWTGHTPTAPSSSASSAPVPATSSPRSPATAEPVAPAVSAEPIQLRPDPALQAAQQLEREAAKAETGFGDAEFRSDQSKALAGDRNAAMRVARMFSNGTNGVPRDERRMVLWLKHASLLEHAGASYQLYLYYLARGRDRDAVRYERRAVRQGYIIPVRLDNRRG